MDYKTISVAIEGPAAIITLSRPDKYNALSLELITEVVDAVGTIDENEAVRGIIITGTDKYFSTGADLNDARNTTTLGGGLRYLRSLRRLTTALEECSKPVIAAVSGWCLTGGLELAISCDIRIAAQNAQFGVTSSKIGSVAGLGGTQRLPRLIGPARAKELLFSSEFIDAAEADRIGLVNHVVPVGEALSSAKAMVARWAERAPLSIWLMKRAVDVGMEVDLASALSFEGQCTVLTFPTQDRKEGWDAFLEKRVPKFTGT
jgi:enoyl-CoA hydratase/carnithine racemase